MLSSQNSGVVCNNNTISYHCIIVHKLIVNLVLIENDYLGLADYFDNFMTKLTGIVNNRTDTLYTHINLFFYDNKFSNCPLLLTDASHEFQ